jgi:TolB-like protein/class 3 adenylate cyclase/tetratricopeptide (TPR) repeat protein
MTEQRRLAAIVSADVAGYSRLMGRDESGTLMALKALRQEVIDPAIANHGGRIVKTTGDGLLLEFPSVVNAVRCAVEVQTAMADRTAGIAEDRRMAFRVGINIGDIIVEGDDIFGDGVNVAARLQEVAAPGGICISSRVHEDVRDRLDTAFDDGGTQTFKNIARPVQVWRWQPATAEPPKPASAPTALTDKPSIAVLPFENLSGDPEQEYFTDGMVEDIITALSRFKSLFVIARNSSFTYKGKAVDIKQVGRELGVRYVLEGSVRKAANRLRISGQLIDASTGGHLWADHFDGVLEDIFELQDRVTSNVVGAIAPKVQQAETERAMRKPTESLDAYDCYLRAVASGDRASTEPNREACEEALRLCYRAIELDPEYSSAYGMAAFCYYTRFHNRWMADRLQEITEAQRLARRVADLGHDDALALCRSGHALAFLAEDLDAGRALIDRALALNPNLAAAWVFGGWIRNYLGDTGSAIKHFMNSIRQSPRDPSILGSYHGMGHAHFCSGDYDEASAWEEKALAEAPNYAPSLRMSAAADALAGRLERAQKAARRVRELDPAFRISDMKDRFPTRRPDHLAKYEEGLRLAGLPE